MRSVVFEKSHHEKNETRRQLTLIVQEHKDIFENIRKKFNPIQYNLIPAHVTLCREDEITSLDQIIHNTKSIAKGNHLNIKFGYIERFEENKGLWLPATHENSDFYELRSKILTGLIEYPRTPRPHITLMHPRNSTCTDEIFEQIRKYEFPKEITFKAISLIEQNNGGKWITINRYEI